MSFTPPFCIPGKNINLISSVTGTLTKTQLGQVTVKGGSMGINDVIMIEIMISCTNNANNKTYDVDFGATNVFQVTVASQTGHATIIYIQNRNSASSQIAGFLSNMAAYGTSTAAYITPAENTANDLNITFFATLTNVGDTASLEVLNYNVLKAQS